MRIPDDIAIVGWDDIEEASFSTPTLTAIAPDKAGIAVTAVDKLLDRLAGEKTDRTEIVSDFRLVVRECA